MSAEAQHLLWFLSHPELYISLVFYITTFAVWFGAIRRVFFVKAPQRFDKAKVVFYAIFFIIWMTFLFQRYASLKVGLGL